eukprot:Gb_21162 [translate_table: standard]
MNSESTPRILEVRVEWGDTLWDLSRRLGLDHWHEIQSVNGLQDDLIFAGEVLKVPLPSSVSMTGCRWRRRHTRPWVVQSGDTAWDISERFGISVNDLERANSCFLDLLYPGEIVQVPEKALTLKEEEDRLKRSENCSNKPNFFDVFPAKRAKYLTELIHKSDISLKRVQICYIIGDWSKQCRLNGSYLCSMDVDTKITCRLHRHWFLHFSIEAMLEGASM